MKSFLKEFGPAIAVIIVFVIGGYFIITGDDSAVSDHAQRIEYIEDTRTGLCFAASSRAGGVEGQGRTFGMATVPCAQVDHLITDDNRIQ